MDSKRCTGMRIVRACSAMERLIDWRIHHVAYVLNLNPRRGSNLLTARSRPRFLDQIQAICSRDSASRR
jgi:hypothetical protein